MKNSAPEVDQNLVRDLRNLPDRARVIDTREEIPEDEGNRILTRNQIFLLVEESGLDLWCVAPEAEQKVYKLLDYGRFKFDQQKKLREQAKKQRESTKTLKEYYFTPGMHEHDYQIRLTQVKEALPYHDIKVGMKINYKARTQLGRHINLYALARDPEFILNRVLLDLEGAIHGSKLQIGEKLVTATLRAV